MIILKPFYLEAAALAVARFFPIGNVSVWDPNKQNFESGSWSCISLWKALAAECYLVEAETRGGDGASLGRGFRAARGRQAGLAWGGLLQPEECGPCTRMDAGRFCEDLTSKRAKGPRRPFRASEDSLGDKFSEEKRKRIFHKFIPIIFVSASRTLTGVWLCLLAPLRFNFQILSVLCHILGGPDHY